MMLLGCGMEPLEGFRIILRKFGAAPIENTQQVLHPANAVCSSFCEPLDGLCFVVWNNSSTLISDAQNACCLDIITARPLNQLGNLFRCECAHLLVNLDFQDDRFLGQSYLDCPNVVLPQKQKTGQQNSDTHVSALFCPNPFDWAG